MDFKSVCKGKRERQDRRGKKEREKVGRREEGGRVSDLYKVNWNVETEARSN